MELFEYPRDTAIKQMKCFIFRPRSIVMTNKDEQSKMTEKEKADWEAEVQGEFQSCIQCLTKRKQKGETKVWTTSSQLNKYKIPRLTRYNSSL